MYPNVASTIRKKQLCSKCNKAAGILNCYGCGKDFCYRHVAEHRQELTREMENLTTKHDEFQQTIAEQEKQPNSHPLIQNISQWEQESINKIRQAAENARNALLATLATHRTIVKEDLTRLIGELSKARNEDDYVETDLKEWTEKLNNLQKDLNAAQAIDFGKSENENVLISKIFINGLSADVFQQTCGDIQILDAGRLAAHGLSNQHAVVCGKRLYSSGQHRIRFKIDQCNYVGGLTCGILSKDPPLESIQRFFMNNNNNNMNQRSRSSKKTFANLYTNEHSFNWPASENYGYHNTALANSNENERFNSIPLNNNWQQNDILELRIDCDQKMIYLSNERTHQSEERHIDSNKCALPWQFFVTMFYANSRVRICEETVSTTAKEQLDDCIEDQLATTIH
ncbi:unnamed protein product [Rotaria socialis]|uniref:Uncharacterized protein n=1 Tax=Rotaria socialis TaxID=392032 RepID=A0A820S2P2_9BILA|nr:unnamed protein product [Rotaria socialis]CAF4451660.1 unnamed protein product [Rotaria socialis]